VWENEGMVKGGEKGVGYRKENRGRVKCEKMRGWLRVGKKG
jgi:hypothetical protein